MGLVAIRQGGQPTNVSLGPPSSGPVSVYGYCDLKYAGLATGPIPNQGPQTLAAVWALVSLATVFLAMRLYCKIWRLRGLWWDDVVLILSWVFFLADGIMSRLVVNLGVGKYPCDIDPRNLSLIGLEGNIGNTVGTLAVVWSKTSFAVTLLRLTEGKTKMFVWAIIISMNIAMGLSALFTWIECTPIPKTWDRTIPGTCWDTKVSNGYGIFAGCLSGVCDIVLALLPWRLVWDLQMQKREKMGVAIAMSMGVFAGSTAFVKSARILTLGSENFTYDGCALLVWAAAEIGTTIMASCIPVLRVFFRDVHIKTISSRHKSGSHASGPYKKQSSGGSGGSNSDKSNTLVGSAAQLKSPFDSPLRGDDSSDDQILPVQGLADLKAYGNPNGHGHIIRTQGYSVEHPHDQEHMSYEMKSVRCAV
ncbi:hypothetical protein QBC46DRAFT_355427 [Diplogelasinospora grovesii]|uniref:Rhodopsin domain-containing protein n=1 Tax=Diplogelasinospora grovesii TaxID=303347 RepID=A0AAN6N4E1_9PEZI|nr:hypothetical protein QBC46DRAFT_355427 [Diplogelasinospora grovesii]